MSRPEFATGYGRTLNTMLDVQKPLREATESTMQRALETLNMPSRHDIVRIGVQVNEVNARLDQLGDTIEEMQDALATLIAGQRRAVMDEEPVASATRRQ